MMHRRITNARVEQPVSERQLYQLMILKIDPDRLARYWTEHKNKKVLLLRILAAVVAIVIIIGTIMYFANSRALRIAWPSEARKAAAKYKQIHSEDKIEKYLGKREHEGETYYEFQAVIQRPDMASRRVILVMRIASDGKLRSFVDLTQTE